MAHNNPKIGGVKKTLQRLVISRIITAIIVSILLYTVFKDERVKSFIVKVLDLIQVLLSLENWWKIVGSAVVSLLLFFFFTLFWKAWKKTEDLLLLLYDFLVIQPKKNKWLIATLAFFLFAFWQKIHDFSEWAEQKLDPVYIDQFSGLPEDQLISIFEQNIIADDYIKKVVIDSVHETARRLNTSPLTFYSPALFECSLNPLIIRKDRVAASWSQFTAIGLQGIKYEGKTWKLSEVISWCENGKIHPIMGLSNAYHMHWLGEYAKTHKVEAIDVYLCLFAPSLIGERGNTKIYGRWDKNPENYLQNQPFDGWYMDGQQIMHSNSHKDGIITVNELMLAMEEKKAKMLKKHFQKFSLTKL